MNKISTPRNNTLRSLKMNKWCVFFLTAVSLFSTGLPESVPGSVCGPDHNSTDQTTLSIHSKRDESEGWVTTISSYSDGSPNGTNVNLTRRIIGCDGKEIVHVKAVIGGSSKYPLDNVKDQGLLFYTNGGKNAVVSHDRRTVHRINPETSGSYAGILTNRHLTNNELFEVKLDKINDKHSGNIAIGVTPISPTDIPYQEHMNYVAIMVYDNDVWKIGSSVKSGYGSNLYALKDGQRVGVMVKDNGNMNVFVDGVDKGIAISDIKYPVYGVIDLHGKAIQATIN